MKLLQGILIVIFVQIISYIQLQGPTKWPLLKQYQIGLIFMGLPIGYLLIRYTTLLNEYFGATWPGRLIGQGIGIIVFALMSIFLFKEPMTVKTGVCVTLALLILIINIYWK